MNDTYFIKRVVGLPGDTVSYRDKQLFVNGEALTQDLVAPGEVETGPDYHVSREVLGDIAHLVQVNERAPPRPFSIVVKPGHYFMMGDNRDNSSDSRVWGQVPEQDIVGKAFAVWMHWDALFSLPSFDRVGLIE